MNTTDNYPIVIFWSDEDDAFIADIPDLHSCSAWGATPEDALRELLVARQAWLEIAHEKGIPLPDPRRSPYLPETARHRDPVAAGAA
jgi:predicted RNase H-like HicB family nuclease